MRIVLDASAAVNIILRTDSARSLIEVLGSSQLVIAPTLYQIEIANTLWKYVRAGELEKETAFSRYEEAQVLIDSFERDEHLAGEALSAAIRCNHPVYDLLYVVLARRHGCNVLTVDKRLVALLTEMDEDLLPFDVHRNGATR
jgi:predicted nucleic acid-binding protein